MLSQGFFLHIFRYGQSVFIASRDDLSAFAEERERTAYARGTSAVRLRRQEKAFVFDGEEPYIVTSSDVDYVLGKASGYSLYSVTDNLVDGFLSFAGGIRIGVSGEGVSAGDKVFNLKYPTSLVIRVPTEIKGKADEIAKKVIKNGEFKNLLVIAPPSGGKTTLLREIARIASNDGFNVCVIDERREIAGAVKGVSGLDLGKSVDVITGVKKLKAYECAIRSMNPDVVVTDEIYGAEEVDAVLDAMRAGVKVAASLHATGVSDLKNTVYEKLQRAMDITVVLTKKNRVGEIKEIIGC